MKKLCIDRVDLRLGKYTNRYHELTSEQLHGLLWLLGEWSCRVREDGTIGARKARGKAAIEALREFHHRPLTIDEVKALMRSAR